MRGLVFLVLAFVSEPCDGSSKFLHEHSVDEKAFRDEVLNAMGSILGCGGQADQRQIATIKRTVEPMWLTMPKTNGRIDRRSLRYLAHRYFMQTSSLMIRGFEPSRLTNESHWGAADVLSQMVPAYVESVLESHHKSQHGFDMQDVIDMILTLDQLIFDSESSLLEGVYAKQGKKVSQSLNTTGMMQVLEEYMIKSMVDAEPEDYEMLLNDQKLAQEILPHYNEILNFSLGRVKTLEFARQHFAPKWASRYSFEDAHEVVGGITRTFQSYWQSECESMKAALIDMDKHGTGRVPLPNFYNTAINSDWRFGESESYLRELGALDETSKWIGPQVIISNYIQATSNCIVSAPHYLVCCVNECESLLGEIESAIQAPAALPSTILALVRNMTSQTTVDHDEPAHLDKHMVSQLEQVAKNHGGLVPLHGRLFAQWLHYVFPHQCPFPHKVGVVSAVTPTEYGEQYIASQEDMKRHADNVTDVHMTVAKEELQWMSQWSPDEELMLDYQNELGGSSLWRFLFGFVSLLLVSAGVWQGALSSNTKKGHGMVTTCLHSHYV
jgi:hypothetical protein